MKALNVICSLLLLSLFSCSTDDTPDVINSNPITVSIDDFTLNIDENPENGFVLGQIVASTNSGTLNYKLGINDQDPYFAMDLDFDTGILTVQDSTGFNFEKYPTIIATAFAMNGDVHETSEIIINLNDIYEKYSYIGDVELNSQQEVHDFGEENHWGVSGIFYVNDTQGDITDLSPLESVTTVGSLLISNLNIITLVDFNHISEVANSIRITDNPILQSLEGLSNDITTGKDVEISRNSSLINLLGFPNIDSIVEDLIILENSSLINLGGVPNINSIGGDLYIRDNSSLINFDGLPNINTVGGDIYIRGNTNLNTLESLPNINSIGGDLFIQGNSSLINLEGLQNINTIAGDIKILGNSNLLNLNGFPNFSVTPGNLYIIGNYELNDITALSNLNEISGSFTLDYNFFLPSLSGLENLTHIGGDFYISRNVYLLDFDGISNLQTVMGNLKVINNPQLVNLCGIENLIINNGLQGYYLVEDNPYNPTQQDIIDGNCSI